MRGLLAALLLVGCVGWSNGQCLTKLDEFVDSDVPYGIAISPDDKFVYYGVVFEGIRVFERNSFDGNLTLIQEVPTGQLVFHLTTDPSGQNLYASVFFGVLTFSRNSTTGLLGDLIDFDGDCFGGRPKSDNSDPILRKADKLLEKLGLTGARQRVDLTGTGAKHRRVFDSAQTCVPVPLFLPWTLLVSPDGRNLYVVDPVIQSVVTFVRDLDGSLTPADFRPLDNNPFGFDVTNEALYVGDSRFLSGPFPRNGTLVVYHREPSTGNLTWIQTISAGDAGTPLDSPADFEFPAASVAVSKDQKYVYSAGSNKIYVFLVDSSTGFLSFVEKATAPGTTDRAFSSAEISADNTNFWVSDSWTGEIHQFARDPSTGKLTHLQNATGLQTGSPSINIEPSFDGKNVYAADFQNTRTIFQHACNGCAAPAIANAPTPSCSQGSIINHNSACSATCNAGYTPSASPTCFNTVWSPSTFTCIVNAQLDLGCGGCQCPQDIAGSTCDCVPCASRQEKFRTLITCTNNADCTDCPAWCQTNANALCQDLQCTCAGTTTTTQASCSSSNKSYLLLLLLLLILIPVLCCCCLLLLFCLRGKKKGDAQLFATFDPSASIAPIAFGPTFAHGGAFCEPVSFVAPCEGFGIPAGVNFAPAGINTFGPQSA